MAQLTEQQRVKRIQELKAETEKFPPDSPSDILRIPWSGGDHRFCRVISIEADAVVFNPDSHRLKSQLQDDPAWADFSKEPLSDAAQAYLATVIKNTRKNFEQLKHSLLTEGQSTPGVITDRGILINGNSRCVAIREFEDASKRVIRVAVLPSAGPQQLALLELHLQMQKEWKEDYSFTNELLFIEEMRHVHDMSPQAIGRELRYSPENPKKGTKKVEFFLGVLDLIRHMQKIPADGLKLSFFDAVEEQHFRDLLPKYEQLKDTSPVEAQALLTRWLLAVKMGVTAVHDLRRVIPDENFVTEFVEPHLRDDDVVGSVIDDLILSGSDGAKVDLGGIDLLKGGDEQPSTDGTKAAALLHLVTQSDNKVHVPVPGSNKDVTINAEKLNEAVAIAVKTGMKEKRSEDRDSKRAEAPALCLKEASNSLQKTIEALQRAKDDDGFDTSRKKTLTVKLKAHRKALHELEQAFAKLGIPTQ